MGNRSKKWACCAAVMAAGLWMAQGSAPMALTAEAAAQPGNLIEQEQRVFHAHFRHFLDQFTRHRTDVSTAVTTNLSFIRYTT